MRPIKGLWLVLALFVPTVLYAGQVYGTIVSEGKGVRGVNIEIQCGKDAPVTGPAAADGSYRINVPQQGQCTLTLPSYEGRPSAVIFSSPNPSLYNFELTKLADGKYELRRR
jgi:hypothetical protein